MRRDFLATKDVAALWTQARDAAEQRKARAAGRDPLPTPLPPISPDTVREYVRLSTPAPPGHPPNRYENNPMPMPIEFDPQRLLWAPATGHTLNDVKRALRAWFLHRTRQPEVTGPLPHLTIEDVARIWTDERRRRDGDDAPEITTNTVKAYVWFSVKAPRGKPPNRFQDNPVPESVQIDERRRVWIPAPGETLADVEQELRDWFRNRDGRGAGGGRKTAKKKS